MSTVTLPKVEYDFLIKSQNDMAGRVSVLENIVKDIAKDEVTHAYAAKLERISASLNKGKGTHFRNLSQVKKFFKTL